MFGKINKKEEVKKDVQKLIICPYCEEPVKIGIENNIINDTNRGIFFPHIHLHGDPLHALICYISPDFEVRNVSVIKSIEISRDSTTFSQIMKKWTNPY
ncbi:MAG: hypothetical protein ACFFDH_25510 [Promethearchaeota archaeon]